MMPFPKKKEADEYGRPPGRSVVNSEAAPGFREHAVSGKPEHVGGSTERSPVVYADQAKHKPEAHLPEQQGTDDGDLSPHQVALKNLMREIGPHKAPLNPPEHGSGDEDHGVEAHDGEEGVVPPHVEDLNERAGAGISEPNTGGEETEGDKLAKKWQTGPFARKERTSYGMRRSTPEGKKK